MGGVIKKAGRPEFEGAVPLERGPGRAGLSLGWMEDREGADGHADCAARGGVGVG